MFGQGINIKALRWPSRQWLALLLAGASAPLAAADEIYRCEAQNGALVFQDQPCHQTDGTHTRRPEVASGIRMHLAPPPAEAGAVAQERYRRYLEQAEKDRREQTAADNAAAARLRAEAALAASQRAPEPAAPPLDFCADPQVADSDTRCRAGNNHSYAVIYPVQVQGPPPQRSGREPPPYVARPGEGSRPTRPPPRTPPNTRAQILDTQR